MTKLPLCGFGVTKMNKKIKISALVLTLCIGASVFTSCGRKNDTTHDAGSNGQVVTTTSKTESKTEAKTEAKTETKIPIKTKVTGKRDFFSISNVIIRMGTDMETNRM